ncbi:MAG: aldehyde dehydrogenase family protein, partial [Parvibaculum sp.]|nr:aldehyde dehydrogenase family protein [Parvibaculum sp.]
MKDYLKFYINGQWVDPVTPKTLDVINPANEEPFARISMGSSADVDKAVAAAKAAFPKFSATSKQERIELLQSIMAVYQKRYADVAAAITEEMGAPKTLSEKAQAAMGIAHINTNLEILKKYEFEEDKGPTRILREPIGVCGFITPWNWP